MKVLLDTEQPSADPSSRSKSLTKLPPGYRGAGLGWLAVGTTLHFVLPQQAVEG